MLFSCKINESISKRQLERKYIILQRRNSWTILLETISTTCVFLTLLMVMVGLRLSNGPIMLSTGIFERMLSHIFNSQLSIKQAELTWHQVDGAKYLEFRVDDLAIQTNDVRVQAPKLYFQISFAALLHGFLLPRHLSMPYVSVNIQTHKDAASVSKTDKLLQWMQAVPIVSETLLLKRLVDDRAQNEAATLLPSNKRRLPTASPRSTMLSAWQYVSRIHVADVTVTVDNALYGRGYVLIQRLSDTQIIANASIESKQTMPISLSVSTHRVKDIDIADFQLIAKPLTTTKHESRIWDIPMTVQLSVQMQQDGQLKQTQVQARSTQGGALQLPNGPVIHIKQFSLDGLWCASSRLFSVNQLKYETQGAYASWAGKVHYNNALTALQANLSGQDVFLKIPPLFEKGIFAQTVDITSDIDFEKDTLIVHNLTANQPFTSADNTKLTARIQAQGEAENFLFPNAQKPFHIKVAAKGQSLPTQFIGNFWPIHKELLPDVREWIVENITAGIVHQATFTLDSARENMFTLTLDASDGEVYYLKPLPPLRRAKGKIVITQETIDIAMEKAMVESDMNVENLTFHADFEEKENIPARVYFNFRGGVATASRLLYGEPLDLLPEHKSFDLRQATGQVVGSATIKLPLLKIHDGTLHKDDVIFHVVGQTHQVDLDPFFGYPLKDGAITFEASPPQLQLQGEATVAYIPLTFGCTKLLTGPETGRCTAHGAVEEADLRQMGLDETHAKGSFQLGVHLEDDTNTPLHGTFTFKFTQLDLTLPEFGFHKPAGMPWNLEVDLTSDSEGGQTDVIFHSQEENIILDGFLSLNNGIVAAHFPKIVFPRTTPLPKVGDPDESVFLAKNGYITFKTPLLDLAQTRYFAGQDKGHEFKTPEKLEQSGDALQILLRQYFAQLPTQVDIRFNAMNGFNDIVFMNPTLTLTQDATTHFNISFHSSVQKPDGTFSKIMAVSLPQARDLAILSFVSQDGGALLKGLNIYNYVNGGRLRIQGVWNRHLNTLDAQLLMNDFTVHKLSLVTHILTLASVSGIEQMLTGDGGVYFERVYIPFTLNDNVIAIQQARMVGSSLGLTLEGSWERQSDKLALSGTIVPLYGLNSFIENIPLIGQFLVGRQGEGVFGIHYKVDGSSSNPHIVIEPASLLAPGPLRRLFYDTIG